MTKTELSERAQVSISFLSDLTTGKANPSLRVMEAIANALGTPLPVLLEFSDLDKETLDALAGGTAPQSMPPGFQRVSAILTDFQAYRVKQWDAENRARVYPKTPSKD